MTGIDVSTNAALFDADFVTDDGILADSARDGCPSATAGPLHYDTETNKSES